MYFILYLNILTFTQKENQFTSIVEFGDWTIVFTALFIRNVKWGDVTYLQRAHDFSPSYVQYRFVADGPPERGWDKIGKFIQKKAQNQLCWLTTHEGW